MQAPEEWYTSEKKKAQEGGVPFFDRHGKTTTRAIARHADEVLSSDVTGTEHTADEVPLHAASSEVDALHLSVLLLLLVLLVVAGFSPAAQTPPGLATSET